jgi:hypothetical protein
LASLRSRAVRGRCDGRKAATVRSSEQVTARVMDVDILVTLCESFYARVDCGSLTRLSADHRPTIWALAVDSLEIFVGPLASVAGLCGGGLGLVS